MFTCPNCATRLVRADSSPGIYWVCPVCKGRSIAIALLRRVMPERLLTELWALAREREAGTKRCPTCTHRMIAVQPANAPCLDVCRTCQFIWFDDQEYERAPRMAELEYSIDQKSTERPLPQRARELLAEEQVRPMAEEETFTGPPQTWQYLPALFGFPVECEQQSSKVPVATYTVAFLIAVASSLAFSNLEAVVATFGLIPAEVFRWGGLTFITSFFLHGGILHLVGNLYFLIMCGDNAEELLGARRFLLLLLAATLGGDVLHVLADPASTIPCIGASGGISGVIAFYALALPHARLGFFFSWYFRFRWVAVPAWGAFLLWIGLQLLGAVEQLSGFSNVSAMAHLGGALVGFVAWLLWRRAPLRTANAE